MTALPAFQHVSQEELRAAAYLEKLGLPSQDASLYPGQQQQQQQQQQQVPIIHHQPAQAPSGTLHSLQVTRRVKISVKIRGNDY